MDLEIGFLEGGVIFYFLKFTLLAPGYWYSSNDNPGQTINTKAILQNKN